MKNFFKSIGKGIIYFFTPFAWIIGISVGGVVGLIVLVLFLLTALICFFAGKNLLGDLPEDLRAKAIKNGEPITKENITKANMSNTIMPQNNAVQNQSEVQKPAQSPLFSENNTNEQIYNRFINSNNEDEFLAETIQNDLSNNQEDNLNKMEDENDDII